MSKLHPLHVGEPDCAVVQDSACFPVREARAYIKWSLALMRNDTFENSAKAGAARDKYLRAVERMKKKAKREK